MKNRLKASVYFNGDFYEFVTMSQGMLAYADPQCSPEFLSPDVSDERLGSTLRMALAASKHVSIAEFQEIFKSGIVQKLAKEREVSVLQQYGYKNRKSLFKFMNCCWVTAQDGEIEIKPTHHKSIDGYSGISNDGPEILVVAADINDSELGAALREGFSRCTSAIS